MTKAERAKQMRDAVHHAYYNILACYYDAPAFTQRAGAAWYRVESERCADFAQRHGKTLAQVAGAAAAISPGLRWETTFAHLDVLMRDPKHPVPTYSREFVRRALACLRGKRDPLEILSGPKVTAFYKLLARVDMDAVVVDGHAWNMCRAERVMFRSRSDYRPPEAARVTELRYKVAEQAYRDAAFALGVAPHAVQATTWIHWRTPVNPTGRLNLE